MSLDEGFAIALEHCRWARRNKISPARLVIDLGGEYEDGKTWDAATMFICRLWLGLRKKAA